MLGSSYWPVSPAPGPPWAFQYTCTYRWKINIFMKINPSHIFYNPPLVGLELWSLLVLNQYPMPFINFNICSLFSWLFNQNKNCKQHTIRDILLLLFINKFQVCRLYLLARRSLNSLNCEPADTVSFNQVTSCFLSHTENPNELVDLTKLNIRKTLDSLGS